MFAPGLEEACLIKVGRSIGFSCRVDWTGETDESTEMFEPRIIFRFHPRYLSGDFRSWC